MQLLTCENTICKKITIPTPNSSVDTPDIIVVVDIPTGLRVASAVPSHGVVNNQNVWTIDLLAAGVSPTLDICFTALDCNTIPTGKTGNVTISTTATESNTANNVVPFTLDYITCDEIQGCSEYGVFHNGVGSVITDNSGEGTFEMPTPISPDTALVVSPLPMGELVSVHVADITGSTVTLIGYNASGPLQFRQIVVNYVYKE